jgi:hypothetical protein
MDMSDYPHVTIAEDGRLCSTDQHRPGFPRVLYDTLLHLDYNDDILVYRARMSVTHSMEQCEISVTILINLEEPWTTTIITIELDDTIDQMTHFALASLCGSRFADTAAMPIALFPFRYQGDPMWQQCLEVVSDPEGPHFHIGMAAMVEYVQASFSLQHNIAKIVLQQLLCMAAYVECHIATSRELA